jgi:hypothetical protein
MDRMKDDLPPEIRAAFEALDERAGARAARVDVEAVAARVLERLRHEESPRLRWLSPAVLRAAAVVTVLVAAGAVVVLTRRPEPTTALRLPVGIAAMDSLSSTQLEAVLQAAGDLQPVADTAVSSQAAESALPASLGVSLDDLSEAQLETLLASLTPGEG